MQSSKVYIRDASQPSIHPTFQLASDCPYTIQLLYSIKSSSTYLVREKDNYGEFPNIYAKVYYAGSRHVPNLVILSDSGTGLKIANHHNSHSATSSSPKTWNIASLMSETLNPNHVAPYLVLTTHCHYDHICGIQHLLDANVDLTVLASSYDKAFVTPWRNLQNHSLCEALGLKAPMYDAQWVEDAQRIVYSSHSLPQKQLQTSITVIQTPGHTPDSISWYDRDSYALCVGDMFYEKESDETRSGSGGHWDREPPAPVIFVRDSNVTEWNASMHRLLDFVRYENRRLGTDTSSPASSYDQDGVGQAVVFEETPVHEDDWSMITKAPSRRRVALCASHVTIGTDAEFALLDMLAFMLRIQLDQVPRERVRSGHKDDNTWLWDDALGSRDGIEQKNCGIQSCRYSVRAPWSIIHQKS